MIGVSMISPDGLAISPRMPASCLICAAEPRAPECDIIQTELIGSPGFTSRMTFIISSATLSDAGGPGVDYLVVLLALRDQAVLVLLLVLLDLLLRLGDQLCLASGMIRSSLPNEMPALHAWVKPSAISRSQKITVSFWPQ